MKERFNTDENLNTEGLIENTASDENIDDGLFDEVTNDDITSHSTPKTVGHQAGDISEEGLFSDEAQDKSEGKPEPDPTESSREEKLILHSALPLESKVEAIIFAAERPIRASEILEILLADDQRPTLGEVEAALRYLVKMYHERNGGFSLEHIKNEGFRFQTVGGASYLMERMFSTRPRPLSRAAFETLAIIAYRQPVTRADIESIRGVDAGSIIKNLMDRDLICSKKRKEDVAGRPMLFETTEAFLKAFKLRNIKDLPPLSAFQPSMEVLAQAQKPMDKESEFLETDGLFGNETLQQDEALS